MRAALHHPQTSTPVKSAKTFLAPLAVLLALGLGIFTAMRVYAPKAPLAVESGTVLNQPRALAPFALVDQDGAAFTNAALQGHWTLLFAGFTHCPDVCPTTLALMKQLAARVPSLGLLFLSLDPERDTPEVLKRYVTYFSPAIRGVTAPKAQIDALCASLGLAYQKIPGANERDYTVDHSAALVLLDPQGRVAGYFQPPHKLDTLAADLARIVASGET